MFVWPRSPIGVSLMLPKPFSRAAQRRALGAQLAQLRADLASSRSTSTTVSSAPQRSRSNTVPTKLEQSTAPQKRIVGEARPTRALASRTRVTLEWHDSENEDDTEEEEEDDEFDDSDEDYNGDSDSENASDLEPEEDDLAPRLPPRASRSETSVASSHAIELLPTNRSATSLALLPTIRSASSVLPSVTAALTVPSKAPMSCGVSRLNAKPAELPATKSVAVSSATATIASSTKSAKVALGQPTAAAKTAKATKATAACGSSAIIGSSAAAIMRLQADYFVQYAREADEHRLSTVDTLRYYSYGMWAMLLLLLLLLLLTTEWVAWNSAAIGT